ncbi:imidazolonepropionase [Caulobacter sp. NIBR2454]|uniref:imidazolonepropionase n=1 Tax=Caulobacter sp. NIBR2454 TaxID=3015996 RepID=UPI0022B6F1AE|nr:imidazolonepropionase [Caulobacter sp. NIBR2454]
MQGEFDTVWTGGHLATMADETGYGVIENGAVAVQDGRIAWIGPASQAPAALKVHELKGAWLTPGLIDCHTHLVYAGSRVREFEMRLEGATYEEIARAGGGILSTMRATREATEDELLDLAHARAEKLIAGGVTTVEIKSGYGLDLDSELKMLRVARTLGEERGIEVKTTFLGAHAVPPEHKDDRDAYVRLIIDQMLPAMAAEGLADAVDAFCESIAFTPAETRRIFKAATKLGLRVKLHADQLGDLGGGALAAEFGALSADHLEHASEESIAAMGRAGVPAVLLPGAFYFLRETVAPPIALMRKHGVGMALATDCNAGTSPITSMPLILNMACTLFRMTPAEALAGVTRHGAAALGLSATHGTLVVGKVADFAIWKVASPAEIAYAPGDNACIATVKGGQFL